MLFPVPPAPELACFTAALGSVREQLGAAPGAPLTLRGPVLPLPHKGTLFQAPTWCLELPRPDACPGPGLGGTGLPSLPTQTCAAALPDQRFPGSSVAVSTWVGRP